MIKRLSAEVLEAEKDGLGFPDWKQLVEDKVDEIVDMLNQPAVEFTQEVESRPDLITKNQIKEELLVRLRKMARYNCVDDAMVGRSEGAWVKVEDVLEMIEAL